MKVFTKINRQLACWEVEGDDYAQAIQMVRDILVDDHKSAILAVIK